MNTIIQNILVFIAVGGALYFLFGKYFIKKKKGKKDCGGDDSCGSCH